MRIRLNELRNIIREELLREAAKSVSDAVNSRLALYSTSNDLFETFVLYHAIDGDKSVVGQLAQGLSDMPSAVRQSLVGAVRVAKGGKGVPAYIDGVRAEQGWGPLLYDIALRYHGPLRPHPESVSPEAQGVWDYYKKKRSTKKGDTEYKAASGASPVQLQLKSRTSVNVLPLKDRHGEVFGLLQRANPRMTMREREFYQGFEGELLRIGNEYLNTLNMARMGGA